MRWTLKPETTSAIHQSMIAIPEAVTSIYFESGLLHWWSRKLNFTTLKDYGIELQ